MLVGERPLHLVRVLHRAVEGQQLAREGGQARVSAACGLSGGRVRGHRLEGVPEIALRRPAAAGQVLQDLQCTGGHPGAEQRVDEAVTALGGPGGVGQGAAQRAVLVHHVQRAEQLACQGHAALVQHRTDGLQGGGQGVPRCARHHSATPALW